MESIVSEKHPPGVAELKTKNRELDPYKTLLGKSTRVEYIESEDCLGKSTLLQKFGATVAFMVLAMMVVGFSATALIVLHHLIG